MNLSHKISGVAGLAAVALTAAVGLGGSAFAAGTHAPASAPTTMRVGTTPVSSSGAEAPEAVATEAPEGAAASADGPGGHADAPGANVDHQFNGAE